MSEGHDTTRTRRIKIVDAVRAVSDVIVSAASNGTIWTLTDRQSRLAKTIEEATESALALFEPGEEEVAWWTQVELYSGWAEPVLMVLRNEPLTKESGELLFTPPRAEMLSGWANGASLGPRFRGQHESAPENIDDERESFVVPYSEPPEQMQWAPILDWRNHGH